jgi:hypothetical protein
MCEDREILSGNLENYSGEYIYNTENVINWIPSYMI